MGRDLGRQKNIIAIHPLGVSSFASTLLRSTPTRVILKRKSTRNALRIYRLARWVHIASLQVSWSFFKRRKVVEDRQLAIDTSPQGHTVGMPII